MSTYHCFHGQMFEINKFYCPVLLQWTKRQSWNHSPQHLSTALASVYHLHLTRGLDTSTNAHQCRLISEGDESANRWEADHLVTSCNQNNLELNTLKTMEMVVDFRKNKWWCTTTPSSLSPSSPPPSLLPPPRTRLTAACNSVCREGDWLQSYISPGPVRLQDWGGQGRLWLISRTPVTNSFRHSPLAGGCGPSGPKPHATRTVSSHPLLALSTRPGAPNDTDSVPLPFPFQTYKLL